MKDLTPAPSEVFLCKNAIPFHGELILGEWQTYFHRQLLYIHSETILENASVFRA